METNVGETPTVCPPQFESTRGCTRFCFPYNKGKEYITHFFKKKLNWGQWEGGVFYFCFWEGGREPRKGGSEPRREAGKEICLRVCVCVCARARAVFRVLGLGFRV